VININIYKVESINNQLITIMISMQEDLNNLIDKPAFLCITYRSIYAYDWHVIRLVYNGPLSLLL